MANKIKVACVQNCATPDVNENIETSLRLSREAISAGAQLIATPEYFSGLKTEAGKFLPVAFEEGEHPSSKVWLPRRPTVFEWCMLTNVVVTWFGVVA